jgi:starch synthase
MVTRVDPQKGIDLLETAWERLLQRPVQFVLLGTGESGLQERLVARARRTPRQVSINLFFDEALARQIYAAADLFLMPSRYEPCGLGQLIALRFGAVPLVRHTGGLIDTIVDPSEHKRRANGFSFAAATAEALLATLDRALAARANPADWTALVRRGTGQDFSWERSARRYLELYRLAREDRHD